MSKSEEIVTKSVFRVIWFGFCVYSTSVNTNIIAVQTALDVPIGFALVEQFGLLIAAMALLMISRMANTGINRQANRIREMIVSLDDEHKDYYVEELYKLDRKDAPRSTFQRYVFMREEFIWFAALITILYVRVAISLFVPA
ncbi:hypothetical protein [Mameliella sp.]|uniref:hypothetical protein n=1 Tax=Mameliella sp. TaxID=1924940 RepID=UPI003B514621